MPEPSTQEQSGDRRSFFRTTLLPVFCAVAGAGAVASTAEAQEAEPEYLPRRFIQGKPEIPPLDSPIVFARQDTSDSNHTHEVLSLIQQEDGDNSFPWTLYAQLRTRHTGGDAVVYYSRLYKDGPGWSCGYHTEVFSKNWGVGIGVNVEMSNQYEGTEGFNGIIGMEMQSLGPKPAKAGVQIEGEGGYETLVRLRGDGETGVDLTGDCDVGVNLHQNSLRLDEGSWIQLDQEGHVRIRYQDGNIEFFNGEKRIAHLPVMAEDHEL